MENLHNLSFFNVNSSRCRSEDLITAEIYNKNKTENERTQKDLTRFGNSLRPRARENDFISYGGEAKGERYIQVSSQLSHDG